MDGREDGRYAPLAVRGGHLNGEFYRPPVASAQVKSALLLAGLTASSPTTMEPHPTRRHTEEMLETFGAKVASTATRRRYRRSVDSRRRRCPRRSFPGRLLDRGGAPRRRGHRAGSLSGVRPSRFSGRLRRMGAEIEIEEVSGTVRACASHLHGVEITAADVPGIVDEIPVLAVAAAAADGVTVISGAEDLRVKESDRLAATAAMLRAFGVEVVERPDGLVVHGRDSFAAAPVESYGDHRIAMAAAVAAATRAEGDTVIEEWDAVATSYPEFAASWRVSCADHGGFAALATPPGEPQPVTTCSRGWRILSRIAGRRATRPSDSQPTTHGGLRLRTPLRSCRCPRRWPARGWGNQPRRATGKARSPADLRGGRSDRCRRPTAGCETGLPEGDRPLEHDSIPGGKHSAGPAGDDFRGAQAPHGDVA